MLRPAPTGGSKTGERIGLCGDATRALANPEGQISGAGPTMNYPKAGAPLGQSVKSPAKPESPTPFTLSDLADLLEAFADSWSGGSIHSRSYLKCTARALKELKPETPSTPLVYALHEIEAHGRLLRAGTIEQLSVIQQSVRYRIMYPDLYTEVTIGLWRGLWGGLVSVCTANEMVCLGNVVGRVTKWLLKSLRSHTSTPGLKKGGLTAQRWAWEDADR